MNIFAVRFFLFLGQFRKDILAHTYGATDITSNSATLIGKAYDDFTSSSSPMIAWFNYGTASGLYIGRTQTISNYSSDCHAASGKVTNVINGKGIEKAMVIGRGLGGIFFTNEDGFYSWSDPEEIMCCGNTYTLIASADGHISQEKSIDIEPQVEGTLNFELRPRTNICAVKKIKLSPGKLMLKRGQSDEVTVTLDGDNCIPIHERWQLRLSLVTGIYLYHH